MFTQSCDALPQYLNKLVYPDIPEAVLVAAAVSVCLFSLGIYIVVGYRRSHARSAIICF